MSRGGKVIDIRTGRAIGSTSSLTHTFLDHVERLLDDDKEFYIVYGRCKHRDVRQMVTDISVLDTVKVIYDGRMPSDTVWIFEGDPSELGFAS
jgi:hypothetical protein